MVNKKSNSKIKRMGSVALVYAFVVLSGLFQNARGEKPAMFPAGETLLLAEFNELRINCYSKGAELHFSFPETTVMIPRSKHEILLSENGTYSFLRSQVVPSDTGWYACAEESIEIDNHFANLNRTHEDVSWIYVYVESEYSLPFANAGYYMFPKTIIVVPGSTIVVPCRPTSPYTPVEFWQNFKPLATDGTKVQFDPKIGLITKEVDFENGEAIFQCKIDRIEDNYSLRLSGYNELMWRVMPGGNYNCKSVDQLVGAIYERISTKPMMITAGSELTLQEGDELKIECYSETRLTFLFPESFSNSSKYEIFAHKSGMNRFLRRSAVADDTGWYGCAGAGEGIQNDIPYHSINYTKKEISWIYVYVNSAVPVTSGLVVTSIHQQGYAVIPCRPTSPGLHMHLNCKESGTLKPLEDIPFHPKLGFVVMDGSNSAVVCFCTTNHPGTYVSKHYDLFSARGGLSQNPRPTVVEAEDSLNSDNLIIRMTGEDLRLLCEAFAPEGTLFRLEWTVPNTVLKQRVQYNRSLADGRFDDSVYSRKKKLMLIIKNISESESGEYVCSAQSTWPLVKGSPRVTRVSHLVEVFDKNGGRYVKLGEPGGAIQVTALEGETIKWLMDLQDFPSANFSWYRSDWWDFAIDVHSDPDSTRRIDATSRRGSPYMLFTMSHLAVGDSGPYRLSADVGNMTAINVSVTLDVQAPPLAIIEELYKYSYAPGERVKVICSANGEPSPNLTFSFLNCPKFPSEKDANRTYLDTLHKYYQFPDVNHFGQTLDMQFSINMSGILTCEACNPVNCSLDKKSILCSASDKPYFTSTNLNRSEVTVNLKTVKNNTIILECYAIGRPYPKVTWFKDNVPLQESRQFKFAYDNRELSISYFVEEDTGRYMCRAENENGKVENYVDIIIEEGGSDVVRLSLIAAAALLLVISWVVIWKQCTEASRRRSIDLAFKNGALDSLNPELSIVDQAELLPYHLKWEFPRELLTFDKILGSGAFGIVKKATAKSICRGEAVTTVAVKLVRSKASLNFITALTRELKILVHLGKHINVVNLLGACAKNVSYGELFVIVEYCQFGNLHDYLFRGRTDFIDQTRSKTEQNPATDVDADRIDTTDEMPNPNAGASTEDHGQHTGSTTTSLVDDNRISGDNPGDARDLRSKYRGDYEDTNLEPISTRDLVYWSWQVSRGMDYLGKRKVVHGDLAARNILLADNNIVKISDFGLSKALYEEAQYRDKGVDPLPVKWMAVESIKDRVFSYQSDIWSFGIVMWEFFTLAKTPYPGIRSSELYHELMNGHRMGKPEYAVTPIYDMMLDCWESDPSRRPAFAKLTESIGDLLDEGFKTHYIEMNSPYLEMDEKMFDDGIEDYLTMSPATFHAASSSTAHEQIEMQNLSHDESINSP